MKKLFTRNKIKKLNIISKYVPVIILVLAICLFVASGWLWWTRSFANADRVFSDMLANNLSSTSVARTITQKNPSSSIDQTVFVSFVPPEATSFTRTVLGEKGLDRKTTTVTTETIGTNEKDLVRYVSAEGAENLSIAQNLDDVLGVWGERDPDENIGETTAFLNEAVFSVVPFGNLPLQQRQELLNFIRDKNVYTLTKAERTFQDGRWVYSYDVRIEPVTLVQALSKYVDLTGVGDKTQLDPASYEGAPPIVLKMNVDILSRQLMSIDYLSTGRVETYDSRNLQRNIELPEQTIPFRELQDRLTGVVS